MQVEDCANSPQRIYFLKQGHYLLLLLFLIIRLPKNGLKEKKNIYFWKISGCFQGCAAYVLSDAFSEGEPGTFPSPVATEDSLTSSWDCGGDGVCWVSSTAVDFGELLSSAPGATPRPPGLTLGLILILALRILVRSLW